MAERARLESVCTGNRTAGSNPALSANGQSGMVIDQAAGRGRRASWRGWVRTRAGWLGGCAWGRVRPRGGRVGGERDAGCRPRDSGRRWPGWRFEGRAQVAARYSRNPALSASGQSGMVIDQTVGCGRRASWRGWVRTRAGWSGGCGWRRVRPLFGKVSEADGGRAIPVSTDDRGKRGARVPRDGALRTSSGPEGSSDKGNAPGAAVHPGSSFLHDEKKTWPAARGSRPARDSDGAHRSPATGHRPHLSEWV